MTSNSQLGSILSRIRPIKQTNYSRLKCSFYGDPGTGKAQPLDAKILTPSGWVCMGDLKVGNDITNPIDGKFCEVIGVFPQGVKEVFRVSFEDGASTECCADHLWLVNDEARSYRLGRNSRIRSTENIATYISQGRRVYIPFTKPIEFVPSEFELIVHPYLLGALLGDRCLTKSVEFATIEDEMLELMKPHLPPFIEIKLRSTGKPDYQLSSNRRSMTDRSEDNPLLTDLRQLGVHGKKSIEKTIPHRYMISSVEDRLSLLQGLCDTDGYATNGSCEYSTSSAEMAIQVKELAWSLGGRCVHSTRIPRYTHNGEKRDGHLSHRLIIRLCDGMTPFRLTRKVTKYNETVRYQPTRRIADITSVGEKECQCIMVGSKDQLYITDDYIVTHNTRLSCTFPKPLLLIASEVGEDSVVGTPGVDVFPLEQTNELYPALDHVVNGKSQWVIETNGPKFLGLGNFTGNKYKTVVLDTATNLRKKRISELFKASGKDVPRSQPFLYAGKEWKDVWTQCSHDMQKLLSAILELPNSNDICVVINSHEANLTYDDGTSANSEMLKPNISSAIGRSVADFLNAEVSYMGQLLIRDKIEDREEKMGEISNIVKAKVGTEYALRVGPDATYRTKFRRPLTVTKPLPDYITDPSFEKIIKVIKGEY